MTVNSTASIKPGIIPGFMDETKNKAASRSFADVLQSTSRENSDKASLSPEASQGSAETGKLTDVQKQILRDKYHLTDLSGLSGKDFDSILKDLNQMGALSDQDYKLRNLRTIPSVPIGTHGDRICPPIIVKHLIGDCPRPMLPATSSSIIAS